MDKLMLLGEERHCPDCRTDTVFFPVAGDDWVCTACDGALTISAAA